MKQLSYFILIIVLGFALSCGGVENSAVADNSDTKENAEEAYNAFISNDSNYVFFGVPSSLIPDSSIYFIDTCKNELRLEHDSVTIHLKTDEYGIVSGHIEMEGGDRSIVREHLLRFASEAFFDDAFDTYILPWRDRPLFEILVFPSAHGLRLELLLRQHV